jgi:protein required for attachment to host cells
MVDIAVVLLAVFVGSYAAPHPFGKDDSGCHSEYCEALEDLYKELPGEIDGMVVEVCDEVTIDLFGDGSVTEFFDKLCKDVLRAEEPNIISQIDEQIEEQGQSDDCDIGKRSSRRARRASKKAASSPRRHFVRKDGNDCDNSGYCKELDEIYCDMPNTVGEIEQELCGELPESFQAECKKLADQVKAQLVAELRKEVVQQAGEFGCDDWSCP